MSITAVLAGIAFLLALLSLFPTASQWPLMNVAVLLLAIALLVPVFVKG